MRYRKIISEQYHGIFLVIFEKEIDWPWNKQIIAFQVAMLLNRMGTFGKLMEISVFNNTTGLNIFSNEL